MKIYFYTLAFCAIFAHRVAGDDALWKRLSAHKIDAISVIYMSEFLQTRLAPTTETLRKHFTHSFSDKLLLPNNRLCNRIENMLRVSVPLKGKVPPESLSFRWRVTLENSSYTVDIYISRQRELCIAKIGQDYYKLGQEQSESFFGQFKDLFGSDSQ